MENLALAALAATLLLLIPGAALAALVVALRAQGRVRAMAERLEALEERLEWRSATPAPAAEDAAPTSLAAPASPADPEPSAPAEPTAAADAWRLDREPLVAGRWLQRVGIVAVLFAAAFFLQHAFESGWVGPTGRVAVGLVAGALLVAWSERLRRRELSWFADGIAGLGGGVLDLAIYAAWGFYALIPRPAAFAAMAAVTALLALLARGHRSLRLALLAAVGGFLTPTLLAGEGDPAAVLFPYLALLLAGLAALAHRPRWSALGLVAVPWSAFHFFVWWDGFGGAERLAVGTAAAAALFLLLMLPPALAARAGERLDAIRATVVVGDVAWLLVALHLLLREDHRWALTGALLGLAVLLLALARLAAAEGRENRNFRVLFAALALAAATLAIPARLDGHWLVMALAVEGGALAWAGLERGGHLLRRSGLALLALAAALLLFDPPAAERLLANARALTHAVVVAALLLPAWRALAGGPRNGTGSGIRSLPAVERGAFLAAAMGANLLALVGASREVWDAGAAFAPDLPAALDPGLARQLGLSLLWTAWGAALVVAGLRSSSRALRWQGLALLAVVVGKVFLYDLAWLERVYRILSFLVLGALLLAVSLLYQRQERRESGEGG